MEKRTGKNWAENTVVLITASLITQICSYPVPLLQLYSLLLKFWDLCVEESMFQDTKNKTRYIFSLPIYPINSKIKEKNW